MIMTSVRLGSLSLVIGLIALGGAVGEGASSSGSGGGSSAKTSGGGAKTSTSGPKSSGAGGAAQATARLTSGTRNAGVQSRLSGRADRMAKILSVRRSRSPGAGLVSDLGKQSWQGGGSDLLDGLINPANPYYWMFHSIANGDTANISKRNLVLNDTVFEKAVIIDECLQNAAKMEVSSTYCTDASYDLQVELTGVSDTMVTSMANPFDAKYDLILTTKPGDESSEIDRANRRYVAKRAIHNRRLLVLNKTIVEMLAGLADKTDVYVQVGDDPLNSVKLDLRMILANPKNVLSYQVGPRQQVGGNFEVRVGVEKLLPPTIRLDESLLQPLGIDSEDVIACARYMRKINSDSTACLKSLEVVSSNVATLSSATDSIGISAGHYLIYDFGKGQEPLDEASGYARLVEKKKNFAEVMSIFYRDLYNRNFQSYSDFGVSSNNSFSKDIFCGRPMSDFLTAGLDCETSDFKIGIRLTTPKVNVFEREARKYLREMIEGEVIGYVEQRDQVALKMFSNPWQLKTIQLYIENYKAYNGIAVDVATAIQTEGDYLALEELAKNKQLPAKVLGSK